MARLSRGPFLFQCKFVEKAEAIGSKRALERLGKSLAAEGRRIASRLEKGWEPPGHYVVMTNARVPDRSRVALLASLESQLPGRTTTRIVPGQDLEALLAGSPEVRLSFPQLLGVGDLQALMQETLDRDLAARTTDLLRASADLAQVYVATAAHRKAVHCLVRHGFTVLTGPPEAGKTSIARMIAFAQAAAGWQVVDCSRGPEAFDRLYRLDARQLFVADDAFGSTEYRPDFAREWEEAFPRVFRSLDDGHWLIWVSRSAPLRAALSQVSLREEAEAFPDAGAVVVETGQLTEEEKAMMLFRHTVAAQLPNWRAAHLRRNLHSIVRAKEFTPLRLRRVMKRLSAIEPGMSEEAVDAALSEEVRTPGRLMRRAFVGLTAEQRAFAYVLLDGSLGLGITPQDTWRRHRPDDANPDANVIAATLVDHVLSEFRIAPHLRSYNWIHPSWRDVTIEALMEDAVPRHRFLERGGVQAMMLALSSAGGSAGTRVLPLLRIDEDWEAIEKRIAELVGNARGVGGMPFGSLLMDAMKALLSELRSPPSRLMRLLRFSLDRVREDWTAGERWIGNDDLDKYYELARAFAPLPSALGPPLGPTWEHHLEALKEVDADNVGYRSYELRRAFEFFALVWEHDPDSARERGFPDACKPRIEEVFEILAAHIDALGWSQEEMEELSFEDLWNHGETVFGIHLAAEELARLTPVAKPLARKNAERAKRVYDESQAAEDARARVEVDDDPPTSTLTPFRPTGAMSDDELATLFAHLG